MSTERFELTSSMAFLTHGRGLLYGGLQKVCRPQLLSSPLIITGFDVRRSSTPQRGSYGQGSNQPSNISKIHSSVL